MYYNFKLRNKTRVMSTASLTSRWCPGSKEPGCNSIVWSGFLFRRAAMLFGLVFWSRFGVAGRMYMWPATKPYLEPSKLHYAQVLSCQPEKSPCLLFLGGVEDDSRCWEAECIQKGILRKLHWVDRGQSSAIQWHIDTLERTILWVLGFRFYEVYNIYI